MPGCVSTRCNGARAPAGDLPQVNHQDRPAGCGQLQEPEPVRQRIEARRLGIEPEDATVPNRLQGMGQVGRIRDEAIRCWWTCRRHCHHR